VLQLLGIEQPPEMTGASLLQGPVRPDRVAAP
jgi:hypothetical protein